MHLANTTYHSYVGVYRGDPNSITTMIQRLLGYFTGNLTWIEHKASDDSDDTKYQCKDDSKDQVQ